MKPLLKRWTVGTSSPIQDSASQRLGRRFHRKEPPARGSASVSSNDSLTDSVQHPVQQSAHAQQSRPPRYAPALGHPWRQCLGQSRYRADCRYRLSNWRSAWRGRSLADGRCIAGGKSLERIRGRIQHSRGAACHVIGKANQWRGRNPRALAHSRPNSAPLVGILGILCRAFDSSSGSRECIGDKTCSLTNRIPDG